MEDQSHRDVADLARFGYKQELRRALGVYSSFAVAFSYISPSTGIFTLYALGIGIGGPAFFWSWPLVAVGQFIIALNFAEVSSHFPVAGSVYQWTKYLSNRHYSWFTGWIYLFAGILTVTAVDVTIPIVLIPLLNNLGVQVENNAQNQVIIGALVLVSTTLLNIFGVRLVAIVNNTGVVFEILGMVVFALVLLIFFAHQSPGVVFDASALSAGGANPYGTFFAAMFMSLFVIYGFDTASTLAEETKNPRREAPRAVIAAVIGAFIIGAIFLYSTIIAIPGNMNDYVTAVGGGKAAPPVDIIEQLPGWAANLYLFVVFAAIYVCCLASSSALLLRGRRADRDRGDRDDLPLVHSWEPRDPHRPDEGLAEGERAVQARKLGHSDQRARACLGRQHADQLPLATLVEQPATQRAPEPRSLRCDRKHPDLRSDGRGHRDRGCHLLGGSTAADATDGRDRTGGSASINIV